MATLRQINRRIRSIQTTAKTTRAMSLVAGSKMRRAQQMALSHRPYADQLRWLLADVVESLQSAATEEGEAVHPLAARRAGGAGGPPPRAGRGERCGRTDWC